MAWLAKSNTYMFHGAKPLPAHMNSLIICNKPLGFRPQTLDSTQSKPSLSFGQNIVPYYMYSNLLQLHHLYKLIIYNIWLKSHQSGSPLSSNFTTRWPKGAQSSPREKYPGYPNHEPWQKSHKERKTNICDLFGLSFNTFKFGMKIGFNQEPLHAWDPNCETHSVVCLFETSCFSLCSCFLISWQFFKT